MQLVFPVSVFLALRRLGAHCVEASMGWRGISIGLIPYLAAVLWCGAVYGESVRTIKFINGTGGVVDDLHIDFSSGPIKVITEPFGNYRVAVGTGRNKDRQFNFYGRDVGGAAPNNTVDLKFSFPGQNLTIQQWWWTKGGTATKDGDRVGPIKHDSGGKELAFGEGPATGDGVIGVTINATDYFFTTSAGWSAEQTASAFTNFVGSLTDDGFSLAFAGQVSRTKTIVAGNLLGDPLRELSVSILKYDSSQQFSLADIAEIPEPSTLFLTGVGLGVAGFLRKRATAAVAAATAASDAF